MLLFWCSWFKYRIIEVDLVPVGKFCFNFSRVLGGVVDCVNVNPSAHARLNHGLRDAQNVCALAIVGTVLKANVTYNITKAKRALRLVNSASTICPWVYAADVCANVYKANILTEIVSKVMADVPSARNAKLSSQ